MLNNGFYEKDKDWMVCSNVLGTHGVIAAGICGKCSAGIDWTTKATFCVKIVSSFSSFVSVSVAYGICQLVSHQVYKCRVLTVIV